MRKWAVMSSRRSMWVNCFWLARTGGLCVTVRGRQGGRGARAGSESSLSFPGLFPTIRNECRLSGLGPMSWHGAAPCPLSLTHGDWDHQMTLTWLALRECGGEVRNSRAVVVRGGWWCLGCDPRQRNVLLYRTGNGIHTSRSGAGQASYLDRSQAGWRARPETVHA